MILPIFVQEFHPRFFVLSLLLVFILGFLRRFLQGSFRYSVYNYFTFSPNFISQLLHYYNYLAQFLQRCLSGFFPSDILRDSFRASLHVFLGLGQAFHGCISDSFPKISHRNHPGFLPQFSLGFHSGVPSEILQSGFFSEFFLGFTYRFLKSFLSVFYEIPLTRYSSLQVPRKIPPGIPSRMSFGIISEIPPGSLFKTYLGFPSRFPPSMRLETPS